MLSTNLTIVGHRSTRLKFFLCLGRLGSKVGDFAETHKKLQCED